MHNIVIDSKPKAFLRWAGSKRQLLPHLSQFWQPGFERYVEPFAGSASLFFKLEPKSALIADKNSELIEVYQVLRDWPEELYTDLMSLPRGKETYYKLRNQNPLELSSFRRVVRFIYLNRFCFNGIYRTNKKGQFNVPYAPAATGEIPAIEQFSACAKLLKNAHLRSWDFGTTLRWVRKGDFVYIDPPYAVEARRVFVEYGPKWFTKSDLSRLAAHLKTIHHKGAVFLLSYADCVEARELFKDWSIRRVQVQRSVAGFGAARRKAYEILISNFTSRNSKI